MESVGAGVVGGGTVVAMTQLASLGIVQALTSWFQWSGAAHSRWYGHPLEHM